MQVHATPFPLYEPGNTNHELANNGSWISMISIVTRLEVVKQSSLGSIQRKDIPYNKDI